MASKLRQRTRRKRSGPPRRRKNKIDRRGAYLASGGSRGERLRSRTATGGESTGRESGIAAANISNRNTKERSLEQSVGSLDRRVEKALKEGNTDLAKDLRSRQNKFVRELAYERARKIGGGTVKGGKTSGGNPILTSKGFDVFQETRDQDFLDPTRKLQNLYPDQYGKMYPIANILNKGPLAFQGIQAALGDRKRKQIPYNLEDMPGVRYPLDIGFGAGEGEPFFGGRSRDPNFDSYPYIAPVEPVEITDLDFDPNPQFDDTDLILPKQLPAIDPEKRSEVMEEGYGDILDDVQNFQELDKEFQKESAEYEKRKANEPTFTDNYPFEVASPDALPSYFNLFGQNDETVQLPSIQSSEFDDAAANMQRVLQGSGYNLSPEIITNLYQQGFLDPTINYFPNPRIDSNPLVDEALASYYQTLK